MIENRIKIDPELLRLLDQTLDRVREDQRENYIKNLLDYSEEIYEKTTLYARQHDVDFHTAFEEVRKIYEYNRESRLRAFCLYGC
jgi:hypothetical protein